MITKMLTAIVMTGALWVAGDAASQKIHFCSTSSGCSAGGCPISAFIHDVMDSTTSQCPTSAPTSAPSPCCKPVSECCKETN